MLTATFYTEEDLVNDGDMAQGDLNKGKTMGCFASVYWEI